MREAATITAGRPDASAGFLSSIGAASSRLFRAWKLRRRLVRMTDFDDHILDDIGVTRTDLFDVLDLPLSQNPYFVYTLGTRHRAAVGLTEETDAVIVVVSEETGEMSLALAGQISRGLSAPALRDRLTQLLRPATTEKTRS